MHSCINLLYMASQILCCTGLGKPSGKIVSLFPWGSRSWQTHGTASTQSWGHNGLKRVGTDNEWEETSQSMKVECKKGAKTAVDLPLPTLIGVTLAGVFQGPVLPQSSGVEEQAGKKVRDRNLQATISSLKALGQECGTSNKLLIHRSRTGSWQWRRKSLAFLTHNLVWSVPRSQILSAAREKLTMIWSAVPAQPTSSAY